MTITLFGWIIEINRAKRNKAVVPTGTATRESFYFENKSDTTAYVGFGGDGKPIMKRPAFDPAKHTHPFDRKSFSYFR